MTLTQAQVRLSKVSNLIPTIADHLNVGDDETRDAIVSAMAYLNSILKQVEAETIDYSQ